MPNVRTAFLLLASVLPAACAAPSGAPAVAPNDPRLAAVAKACDAPRDWLRLDASGRVQVVTTGSPPYAQMNCLFREIDSRGLSAQAALIR